MRDEVAIFFISTPAYGQEPWITDGTSSGTRVLDIRQGSLGSNFLPYIDGVVMNDRLYFPADEGTGIELFATDGTTTYKVKEINPTSGSGFFQTHSQPHAFFAHRDKVFFMANDGIEGFEMWVSDGSEEGTQRLIVTQAGLTERGDIPNYFAFKNRVLFQLSSQSVINSYDLYVSDGTPSGTSLLKDFRYSHEAFVPLLEDENWLYFKAVNSSTGTELWRTNGTESGTSLVKNINTRTPFFNLGLSSSAPFYRLDDRFYFLANSGPTLEADGQIWQSDGNPSHT
ncbi:MAG: hypothetical protein P5690_25500, partial [Limnospira sp. PMC 1236.20]|uniref:hypothetical protein n=1 Tax=Limnospira sp. PMC 1236.20 TaxID=2981034 RepID=UPI0028E11AA2